jgi:hypothetical protein
VCSAVQCSAVLCHGQVCVTVLGVLTTPSPSPRPAPGPQAAVEDPEAVRQLHRKFLRAGADVMQAYAIGDKLTNRGNKVVS